MPRRDYLPVIAMLLFLVVIGLAVWAIMWPELARRRAEHELMQARREYRAQRDYDRCRQSGLGLACDRLDPYAKR